ncbi:MAG: transposase, partial [Proteobacteria bacterium]|nr:transposase [Pseudomonadota bacterium]
MFPPPFQKPEDVLEYLGRYTHRVAISNHRIISLENGKVTFGYRNRKAGTKETLCLDAVEFIRRFMQHILPSGFMKIRSYGFLANRYKKQKIGQLR